MSMIEVSDALNQGWSDGAFFDDADWFVPNMKETPPSGSRWAQTFLLPNQPDPTGLGNSGDDVVTGIFQVDLNYPLGEGESNIIAKAESIRTYFKAGRKFTSGTTSVAIRSAGRSPGTVVDQNYRISMTIAWEVRIQR